MDKKKEYEEEIGSILRKVMETSYQRKRNSEKILSLLKSIREETEPEEVSQSLITEYMSLRERVLKNLGVNEK
ncbi:hypothetical protein NEAUS04_1612 [Nematocida ausubeli]|uniref:Uncharacterized protein n=1 Tax=Nematocida ausubeli (strain ATCC PRA-371 / ERTm2) TaxID=1913371 RepID=H8ZBD9_NEMA1|nr:uncharacterized protein NESG_01258 [Nematocida ausubeli]EHY66192.1 hypothetical protein NERG_00888 [Nematocida ausubeli]KAI5136718.1 hypothetical protein NEAUS07_1679 [Nematocida ausubeli]KAI5137787.1 hypothetical protein NEAUS06_2363 [Nematocida ausubeli]KAI5149386.1 hypothetical protein NEAUS05_1752 [Nematocida ausubeli]KAI5163501.1 hypothetical protein NEAUS04_1612 [Nematocida ausubeli]